MHMLHMCILMHIQMCIRMCRHTKYVHVHVLCAHYSHGTRHAARVHCEKDHLTFCRYVCFHVRESSIPRCLSEHSHLDHYNAANLRRTFFVCADERPAMTELSCLETSTKEKINIIREIGTNYHSLGTHLLQDETGARVANISYNRGPEEVTREILRQWLEGSGQKPVTWRTLTEALDKAELYRLARDIRAVKMSVAVLPMFSIHA